LWRIADGTLAEPALASTIVGPGAELQDNHRYVDVRDAEGNGVELSKDYSYFIGFEYYSGEQWKFDGLILQPQSVGTANSPVNIGAQRWDYTSNLPTLPGMISSYDYLGVNFQFTTAITVGIDIKPGSYPNTINLGSNGVVPVGILSGEGFDATAVAPENVFLAGSGVAVRGKGNKYLAHEEDVNGDDLMDLVVQVETENLDPGTFQDGYAVLTIHESSDPASAVLYQGMDEITIVPPE